MMEQDRLSDLPGCVLDKILSRLPIKDMVRTSVLSSDWRYRWTMVPSLAFNDRSLPLSSDCERVIDRILLLHMGVVHKFKLSYRDHIPFEEIDKWILYLSRRSIKKLMLQISSPTLYDMPYCIFSARDLTHLNLHNCSLWPPLKFAGFEKLKCLILTRVEVIQQNLEYLISTSPALTKLCIIEDLRVDRLNIRRPNLSSLEIKGKFVDVSLENASRLTELYIDAKHNNVFDPQNPEEFGDFVKLMSSVPLISRLMIKGVLIQYMAAGNIPRELPVPCINLTFLSISLDFNTREEVSVLICLLRSSPNLNELQIESNLGDDVDEGTIPNVLECDDNGWELSFTQLQLIKIHDFHGEVNEMGFVKYMLLTSPSLECMTIKLEDDHFDTNTWDEWDMLKEMMSFKRVSTEVQINVSELTSRNSDSSV